MIKELLERYIQKTKNKNFKFDENISSILLFSFFIQKIFALVRGLKFYFFHKRGKLLFLGKNVQLFNKCNIIVGENVNIGNNVTLSALGKRRLIIGNNVNIGSFSQIIISTSFNKIGEFITIGDNIGIGEFSYIGGGGGTTIEKNTIIGQYFSTHPENHTYKIKGTLIREQETTRKGIHIGSNCWIGSKVTILDGVTIGNNCVIAAGAVVNKSFPSDSLIGGVPAKILKELK